MEGKNPRPPFVPTPEEIAEECRKIRDGWSKEKWANQSRVKSWEVPLAGNPDFKAGGVETI